MKIALLGNPNTGTTSLFNVITNTYARIGNFPGVTVEKNEGTIVYNKESIGFFDLPGIYSLSQFSRKQVISRDYIFNKEIDVIVNVIDVSNIERNLYLTTQLIETGKKVVVALNFYDLIEKSGGTIDIKFFEKILGCRVVPISARKNKGIDELLDVVCSSDNELNNKNTLINQNDILDAVEAIQDYVYSVSNVKPDFFNSMKLLEDDKMSLKYLKNINSNIDTKEIDRIVKMTNENVENSWDILIAQNRYDVIENIIKKLIIDENIIAFEKHEKSLKVDKILTNRVFALPIFFVIMFAVFWISFGPFGTWLTDWVFYLVVAFISFTRDFLTYVNASNWVVSFFCDGVIPGVGMVFTFLPQILILYFCLALLEDIGYMSRIAFIVDRTLRFVGLSGKALLPILMGFGCSVPALMATRTLNSERDRRLAIILTPFVSCSARLPIYMFFVAIFFPNAKVLILFSLYMLGIIVLLISGFILKKTVLRDTDSAFIIEIPPYRLPTIRNTTLKLYEIAGGYVKKTGFLLLVASIIIWFGQYFTPILAVAQSQQESIIGVLGSFISPIFEPLGLGSWQISAVLIIGFLAKEAVVPALAILFTAQTVGLAFTPITAYIFMVFTLLYLPCIVIFATIKKEMGTWKWTAFTIFLQTLVAWIGAFIIYNLLNFIF